MNRQFSFFEQKKSLASSGEYDWFAGNVIRYFCPLTLNDLTVDVKETGLLTGDIACRELGDSHNAGQRWPSSIEFASHYFTK